MNRIMSVSILLVVVAGIVFPSYADESFLGGFVSPVSLWEISNKCRQGKLKLALPPREWFSRVCARYRLTTLPISNETMFLAGELEEHHRDSADRMIIAAAKLAGVAVVTADRNFPLYGISVIR